MENASERKAKCDALKLEVNYMNRKPFKLLTGAIVAAALAGSAIAQGDPIVIGVPPA